MGGGGGSETLVTGLGSVHSERSGARGVKRMNFDLRKAVLSHERIFRNDLKTRAVIGVKDRPGAVYAAGDADRTDFAN